MDVDQTHAGIFFHELFMIIRILASEISSLVKILKTFYLVRVH